MPYIVLARKYRPQDFKDLAGQETNIRILEHAIEKNRIAHAYLFSGSRGVGKTSAARIFSKMLNCEKGITITPCNKCPACRDITDGRSLNVLEIDGASNRGVDEIRDLRDKVKYPPSGSKYKIYIIDEVHMLTPEAFNALLKTLEEPPGYIVFIFATTEPHKIPATILSRCLRFDFKRITPKDLLNVLKKIACAEKIDIEDDALKLIGYYSDGSLRDALGILDQVSLLHTNKISHDDIIQMLGLTSLETFFIFSESIINNDINTIMKHIDELIYQGKNMGHLLIGWIDFFRDMLRFKMSDKNEDVLSEKFSKQHLGRFSSITDSFKNSQIGYVLEKSSDTFDKLRHFVYERYLVEFLFLNILNKFHPDVGGEIVASPKDIVPEPKQNVPVTASDISLDEATRLWSLVLGEITGIYPNESETLRKCVVEKYEKNKLVLKSPGPNLNKRTERKILKDIQTRLSRKAGTSLDLDFVYIEIQSEDDSKKHIEKVASQDKSVRQAIDMLGGKITNVTKI